MGKITIENRNDNVLAVNCLAVSEAVDERVCDAFAAGAHEEYFLPVSVYRDELGIRLECTVGGLIPLKRYFQNPISKKLFLDVARGVVKQVKYCDNHHLNAENLELDSEYIFVEPMSGRLKCIFWPLVNGRNRMSADEFLKRLPQEMYFQPYENREYLLTYEAFFNDTNPFSLTEFERLLNTLEGAELPIPEDSSQQQQDAVTEAEPKDVFCGMCGQRNPGTAVFCGGCGRLLNNIAPDDTTMAIRYGKPKRLSAKLVSSKTGDTFVITGTTYKIGKSAADVDLVITDNRFVSRHHATISMENDRYYITDENSTNRTYVNGLPILPHQKNVLVSGTKIRLADEELVFVIGQS